MKKIIQLIAIAILLTNATFAQTNQAEEKPYIEVTGTAEKEVIPDEIYIGITIRERYEGKQKISIEEQEEKLRTAIKSIGVSLDNLYLADADAGYVRVKWAKKDVLTQKDYTLKVADATTVGKVFQELGQLEIKDARITKTNHSKIESLRKEVKILAIKAAKEKADYLLAAIGEQTGKALIVVERGAQTITSREIMGLPQRNIMSFAGSSDKETDKDIQFQKIKIEASIYVKFSIK